MNEPIIKTEQARVIYNEGKSNEVRSLMDVSIEIFPQEYVIIHGPSGCGKSTLMYSIAGLQMPTSGRVMIAGKEITKMNKGEKLQLHQDVVGMIFQAFYLIESLSVIDNVCLPMTFKGKGYKERRERGLKLLQRFGIGEQAYKFPSELSGGQKQRVAIARALINDPQIILADEPVGNLDSESSLNVMKIIKELNEIDKKTIILVTHNSEHLHYGDRIISMRDGKIISEEINKEKRPPEAAEKDFTTFTGNISPELKVLMRAFKNLSPEQVGSLLVPYKSKQLLSHILLGYSDEQMNMADNLIKEMLFGNIDLDGLAKGLDKKVEEGGANWDIRNAKSFAQRADGIIKQSNLVKKEPEKAPESLVNYLVDIFDLNINDETKKKFSSFLKLRVENKVDYLGLKKSLDSSRLAGGLGLYKNTVEKVVREVEIIMLLGYSN
jgi:putative ABC transport system ATP-binding protein